ncbi:MAG: hypothetical protein ACOVVK_15700 [Elsteraceae bacterium]
MNRTAQQGFLLPIALAAVLVLTLLMIPLTEGVSVSVDRAQRARERFAATLALERANAVFLLKAITQGGESEDLRADSTAYAEGDARIAAQELRGLVSLDGVTGATLRRVLAAFGVDPEQAQTLANAYFDYIDADDFARAGGSERDAYAAAGMPPPRNAPLLTPSEAINIVGWRDQRALWREDAWTRSVTVRGPGGFDPKQAPREALMSLEGVAADLADALIAARVSTLDLLPREAKSDPRGLISSPSGAMRLTVVAGKMARRMELRVAAVEPHRPWRVDWSLPVPVSSTGLPRTHDDLPAFPPLRLDPPRP